MKYQIVEILWEDSAQMRGWVDKEKYLPTNNLIHSVGFLLEEDEGHVVISDSISEYSYNNPFIIPKVAIKSLKKISKKSNK
jgi:hypothetical protein